MSRQIYIIENPVAYDDLLAYGNRARAISAFVDIFSQWADGETEIPGADEIAALLKEKGYYGAPMDDAAERMLKIWRRPLL